MQGTRRIIAQQPTPWLIVCIAVIAILFSVLAYRVRVTPAMEGGLEPGDAVGAGALQRARLLYQHLEPGETTPPLHVAYDSAANPVEPSHVEVVVSSAEEETSARFLAVYDIRTAQLRRLTWSGETPEQPVVAGLQHPLDRRQAVHITLHYLRLVGVNEIEGPWTEALVQRVEVSSPAGGLVWHVHLTSPRWSIWTVIDALNAEPTQLFVTPGPRRD